MRRSQQLADLTKTYGLDWGGWDEKIYRWRVGDAELKTLDAVQEFLDAFAQVNRRVIETERVAATQDVGYRAQKGDSVVVDRGGRMEVHGIVQEVRTDGTVVVHALRVLLEGIPRPDLQGLTWYPAQNGTPTPWGPSLNITKA